MIYCTRLKYKKLSNNCNNNNYNIFYLKDDLMDHKLYIYPVTYTGS